MEDSSYFWVNLILIWCRFPWRISANVHVNEILFVLVHWSPGAILLAFVLRLLLCRCLALLFPDTLLCLFVHRTVDVRETHFLLPDYNPVQANRIQSLKRTNFRYTKMCPIFRSPARIYGTWCKWTRTNSSKRFAVFPRRLPLRVLRFLASLTLGKNVGMLPWQSKTLHLIDT